MSLKVDLNSDLGESFGVYRLGEDEKVLSYITSANVACGYHAGDHNVMAKTVEMAKETGTQVGAHPGFPDLGGFGRREMKIATDEIFHLIIYQIGALEAFCQVKGVRMQHVKPHGALYNIASKDRETAEAIAEGVFSVNPSLYLYALSGSELAKAGEKQGLHVVNEVFADRTYQPDGTLTPRTQSQSVIHDVEESAKRVIQMVEREEITALDGTTLHMKADTVCVHGDNPDALSFVQRLRKALENYRVLIKSPGEK